MTKCVSVCLEFAFPVFVGLWFLEPFCLTHESSESKEAALTAIHAAELTDQAAFSVSFSCFATCSHMLHRST